MKRSNKCAECKFFNLQNIKCNNEKALKYYWANIYPDDLACHKFEKSENIC